MTSKVNHVLNIGLLGFGTVGSGFFQLVSKNQGPWLNSYGVQCNIIGIGVKDPSKHPQIKDYLVDPEQLVQSDHLDILVEAISGECPYPLIQQAIENEIHIITANKSFVANHIHDLQQLATNHHIKYYFGAAVGGGLPVLDFIEAELQTQNISQIQAILNGTSNYILSRLEDGYDLESAIKTAVEAGFAEFDVSNDLNGTDTAYKVILLLKYCLNEDIEFHEIKRVGLSQEWLTCYKRNDSEIRSRLIANIELGEEISVSIEPREISPENSFYHVRDEENAILINGDCTGPLFIQGRGAGKYPTSNALIRDLITLLEEIL